MCVCVCVCVHTLTCACLRDCGLHDAVLRLAAAWFPVVQGLPCDVCYMVEHILRVACDLDHSITDCQHIFICFVKWRNFVISEIVN